MTGLRFTIYPPAETGSPWLAVVLAGDKPLDVFGCPDQRTAERVLKKMQARRAEKPAQWAQA